MMRKEILAKRDKIHNEINMLNKIRFEEEKDNDKINKQIEQLRKKYNYFNNLLKVIK